MYELPLGVSLDELVECVRAVTWVHASRLQPGGRVVGIPADRGTAWPTAGLRT